MKLRYIMMAIMALTATPALALECETGMRPFTHAAGETCIPADPQRIVTLQDQNGLLPLMELGVRPVGSAGATTQDGENIFRRMEGYDTTGITWVGTYGGPPGVEEVAAMEPDLIVASPWPPEAPELYGDIAPVVVIDMFDQPLPDALYQFADLVNRTDRAKELEAELNARIAAVREALGPARSATTVSFLTARLDDGQFYPANPTQAMGVILRGLDPIRPAAEQGLGSEREYRSIETIGDHNADVMFQLVFDADNLGFSSSHDEFLAHPLVGATEVGRASQVYQLNGSTMVGSAWGKVMNGLDQISAVLLQDDLNRDLVAE
ncbi:ABC transporter substrate-binding protein [Cognatiyoonia sp. IB215182]|uniref:ABC transporter substrate-binding protein n=1 Tax=Cognatiyoonia sp. IB215182 TaxID=3097353 RepID=UPI002A158E47|nr:ABC transporter substrate-binding protein [Cognatiyoonia sp. IB215182]MDX8354787.1 ABC transporter substrate-binding protein [Cognatiyoonia sp. IB215182]